MAPAATVNPGRCKLCGRYTHPRPSSEAPVVHRVDKLLGVDDPVLEQLADPAGAVGQELPGVHLGDVLGQHEHR